MPLVIPELSYGNKDNWQSKLVGKKISESTSDVTVCPFIFEGMAFQRQLLSTHYFQTFAKKDLPKEHRIVKPNDAVTMDYNKDRYYSLCPILFVRIADRCRNDRLNVYLDDEGIVRNIGFS